MTSSDTLMPGPEGKTPRFYEVDRGQKTESYISAVSGQPMQPPASAIKEKPNKPEEAVELVPPGPKPPRKEGQIGLTEAELLKYRDNRFWKLLRLFLFIVFWIFWLLMFVAVILLVFFSPGCSIRQKPSWWQNSVNYHLWVPSFQDSDADGVGDVKGLMSRLENLRKSGVHTVWPSPFLLSDNFDDSVRNFHQMDSQLGPNQMADELIEKVHDLDMKMIITIPIATTSTEHEWFLASAAASQPENKNYSQFYYWTDKQTSPEFFSSHKTLFYLHRKNSHLSAVLNWQNSAVRVHMMEVLSKWMDRGVDGFYLSGIEYLARTPNGTQPDWTAIYDILRDIRHHVDDYSKESVVLKDQEKKIALFASREEAKEKDKRLLSQAGLDSVINYEFGRIEKDSEICHKSEGSIAMCVHEIVSDVLLFHALNEEVWPHWEFGNQDISRVASRVNSRLHAELLILLQLILPGSNNIYYGEEIGMRDLPNDTKVAPQRGAMQWDSSLSAGFSATEAAMSLVHSDYKNVNWELQYGEEKSPLKMFSKLAKLRQRDETLNMGKTLVGRLVDGAFTVTRFFQEGNQTTGNIYVAAVNFSPESVSLPLVDLPAYTKLGKSQIVTTTSNVKTFYARQSVDLSQRSIQLEAQEGLVFRYSV